MAKPVIIDCETEAIQTRPHYPPRPVGVGIKFPGKKGHYYAWGHPTGNNCTQHEAIGPLQRAYAHKGGVCFHNSKFDLDVLETHLGLKPPPPELCHDTMLLAYLHNPHQKSISLKTIGPILLGRPPDERDELRDWILAHVPGAKKTNWGAFISQAPGDLVGRYCVGDLDFTGPLFDYLYPRVIKEGKMGEPYLVEQQLVPVLLENERIGVRVDLPRLQYDAPRYEEVLRKCDAWIRRTLKAPDLNVDATEDLADAIQAAYPGISWVMTAKGHRSTSKDNLKTAVGDVAPKLVAMLTYRSVIEKVLSTYLLPWLRIAEETGGRIYTQWNSTAQPEGGGTRTGRLSSSNPVNYQNIPTEDTAVEADEAVKGLKLQWALPVPRMRGYILPDAEDHVIIGRDLSQQEPRMLAYFENDRLEQLFKDDPMADVYTMMAGILEQVAGIKITRKTMKTLVLAIIYGLGLGSLAMRLGSSRDEAAALRKHLFKAFPGIEELINDLKEMARNDIPMRTWGGRLYYAEESKIIAGVLRSFAYKLVNYLCQGSSADYTKRAMLRYHKMRRYGRLMLSAHDELVVSAPSAHWRDEMKILKEAMEDVPGMTFKMRSDGECGSTWGSMVEVE